METAYALLLISAAIAATGFLVRQALLDRDKRLDEVNNQIDLLWISIRDLQNFKSKSEVHTEHHLKALEKLSRHLDRLGDLE